MEKFYFICGCILMVVLVLWFVLMVIEECRYLLVKKHYDRVHLLSRIHQCESDLSCFRVEYEKNISNLECLINKQNNLITNQIKLISKKCKD